MQRLIAKHFGPLHNVDLEIRDFMVLIGPQASGKSTIAKLVWCFGYVRELLLRELNKASHKKTPELSNVIDRDIPELFRVVFHLDSFVKPGITEVSYVFDDTDENPIRIDLKGSETKLLRVSALSHAFQQQLEKLFQEAPVLIAAFSWGSGKPVPQNEFIGRLSGIFKDVPGRRFFRYIPENRNDFPLIDKVKLLESDRIKFANDGNDPGRFDDAFFSRRYASYREDAREFIGSDYALRLAQDKELYPNDPKWSFKSWFWEKWKHMVGGTYSAVEGKEYVTLASGETIPITVASSGQQANLGIGIGLLYDVGIGGGPNSYFIEEPEISSYPVTQKLLVEAFAAVFNQHPGNRFFITTHSPYILTELNNLLLASETGRVNPVAVSEIVPEVCWLDPSRIGAYFVENAPDKQQDLSDVHSIIGKSGLIGENEIDDASDVMGDEFDALLEIRLTQKQEQP